MNYRQITVVFTDGEQKSLTIDAVNGARVEDGVVRFGRSDGTKWRELFAAPLVQVKYWG